MPSPDSFPIFSSLGSDAEMLELVEEFVSALRQRIKALEEAASANDLQELTRLAHQLKGASGSYGFDVIGQAAAVVEMASRDASSLADIEPQLAELITLCHRATTCPR